jgi:hypothetical protein
MHEMIELVSHALAFFTGVLVALLIVLLVDQQNMKKI